MIDSRAEMDRLLKQIEQEAYSRGYSDAIAAVTAAATAAAPKLTESPSSPPAEQEAEKEDESRGPGRPATAVMSVRNAIWTKPGMKGADLVRYLDLQGTPVLERTVRSCLRRLKNVEVRQRDGRWYPKRKPEAENGNGEALAAPPH
jgi:hypothetical protein